MTITRRNFLIGSGAAAVTGFTLHKVPAVLEMIPEWGGERYGLLVDYTTKTISIAPDHPGMTVYQLQRTITQLWKDEDEFVRNATFPLIPVTPELIHMDDGWIIRPDSMNKLETGSVVQVEDGEEAIYRSIVSLGTWSIDHVNRDGVRENRREDHRPDERGAGV